MEPYILDLRDQGCPMALLLAKRASKAIGTRTMIIYTKDEGSRRDIVRYFEGEACSVQCEDSKQDTILTVYPSTGAYDESS